MMVVELLVKVLLLAIVGVVDKGGVVVAVFSSPLR